MEPIEIALHDCLTAELRRPRWERRLRKFRCDPDDAIQDCWIVLVSYVRRESVRNLPAFVRGWVPKLINRVIDKSMAADSPREMIG